MIGGTGLLGWPVVKALLASGFLVRVFSRFPQHAPFLRHPNLEMITGNVEYPAALDEATRDCWGIHISLNSKTDPDFERRSVSNIVDAAQTNHVQRITYLSGASVNLENTWFPGTKSKYQAEQIIRASGIGYTMFKATWFMESLDRFIRGKRAFVIGKQPNAYHWIAAQDYARMVTTALQHEEASLDKDFFIYGREAYTLPAAIKIYCSIVYPYIRVFELPFWVAEGIALLGNRQDLKAALPFFRYCSLIQEPPQPPESKSILDAPEITLPEWCKQIVGKNNNNLEI